MGNSSRHSRRRSRTRWRVGALVAVVLAAATATSIPTAPATAAPAAPAAPATPLLDPTNPVPVRVSVSPTGADANGPTISVGLSADGRVAVFASSATNLVPGDTDGVTDVFVRDLDAETTELVSQATDGALPNANTYFNAISPDGRYVAFTSVASNLVANDTNNHADLFLRDRALGTTTRIGPTTVSGPAELGAFSADGRYLAFSTWGAQVASDSNGIGDAYRYDLAAGTYELASVRIAGLTNLDSNARLAQISRDGRFVLFASSSGDLVVEDGERTEDVFVRDMVAGTTTRITQNVNGGSTTPNGKVPLAVSPDGSLALFTASDAGYVAGDTNAATDVFARDLVRGTTTRLSVGASGEQSTISANSGSVSGDMHLLGFVASGISPSITGSTYVVKDLQTGSVQAASLTDTGAVASAIGGALSADGTHAAFVTSVAAVPDDQNGDLDAYVIDRGDVTGPIVRCTEPDGQWHPADVSLACVADDAGSGLADPADASFALATDVADGTESADAPTASRSVCDGAGNCTTAGPIGGNRVDRKAPTVTLDSPADGATVTRGARLVATYSCADGAAGGAICAGTEPSGGLISTATAGPASFSVTATDVAGNTTTTTHEFTVVDPTLSGRVLEAGTGLPAAGVAVTVFPVGSEDAVATTTTAADGRWAVADLAAGDYEVGFARAGAYEAAWYPDLTERPGATVTVTSGAPVVVDMELTPLAGVDTQAPTVTCSAPDGAWHRTDSGVTCTATDGGSGLADPAQASFTLTTSVPDGIETADAATDGATVCDGAGNCATVEPVSHVKVDRKAPAISLVRPTTGGIYRDGVPATAQYACTDGGSGSASCAGTIASGAALPQSAIGSHPFAIDAADAAGNTAHLDSAWSTVGVHLSGVIRSGGTPLAGVLVELVSGTSASGLVFATQVTGVDGRHDFANLPAGRWGLRFTKAGYQTFPNTQLRYLGGDEESINRSVSVQPTDTEPPTIDCDAPAAGAVAPVEILVTCSAVDLVSGLANPSDAGFTLTTTVGAGHEDAAAETTTRTVCDLAGNCAVAGPYGPYEVDLAAPTITITSPLDGAVIDFGVGQPPIAGFTCTDIRLLMCAGSNPNGAILNPLTPGTHTLTVEARDVWGRMATKTSTYRLKGTSYRGKLMHASTEANIVGATVEAWAVSSSLTGPPDATATTAADGTWRIEDLYPNLGYRFRFSTAGYTPVWSTQSVAGSPTAAGAYVYTFEVGETPLIFGWVVPDDPSPPVVQCNAPPPNAGYFSGQVTVSCTASDPESGLASGTSSNFTLVTNVAAGTETTTAQTNSSTVCNRAGACTTAGPFGPYRVDRKAPAYTCSTPPTTWQKNEVSLLCTATDGGAGLSSSSPFFLSTNVGAGQFNASASTNVSNVCDLVGNCVPAQVTGLKVDRTVPVIVNCQSASSTVWNANNVTLMCTVTDSGSGPASLSVPVSTTIAAGAESATAMTTATSVCDVAGNCVTIPALGPIKVDRKAPTVSCPAADGVWHNANVTVSCTHSDAGSGLPLLAPFNLPTPPGFSLSTSVAAGTENANASTASASKCDAIGNCTTAVSTGHKVDLKAPTASGCTAVDTIWHATNVTVGCTAADSGSGLAQSSAISSSTTITSGTESSSATTAGTSTCDTAGNCAVLGATSGWKIDRKVPAVTITTPTGSIAQGSTVLFSFSCTDSGAGLSSCVGQKSDGSSLPLNSPVPTSTLGSNSVKVVATDLVGNTVTITRTYTVTGAILKGTLQENMSGRLLGGVSVVLHPAGSSSTIASTTTAADGKYQFSNVAVGTYQISYSDGGAHTTTWYQHATSQAAAATINVPTSSTVLQLDDGLDSSDVTPPTVTCGSATTAWQATEGVVTCTASDPSGLVTAGDASFTLTTSVGAGNENAAASTGSRLVCDKVANCALAGPVSGFRIDRKGPSIDVTSPAVSAAVSLNEPLSAAFTCADTGAGLATCGGPTADGQALATTSYGTTDVVITATDTLGNITTVHRPYRVIGAGIIGRITDIDTGAPVVGADVRLWLPTGSNIVAATTTGAGGLYAFVDIAPGTYQVQSTKSGSYLTTWYPDRAARGETVPVTVATGQTLTIDDVLVAIPPPDSVPPVVTCGGPDGLWHDSDVTVNCTASDALSGLRHADEATFTLSTSVANGTETATAATGTRTICDRAFACTTVGPLAGHRVDKRPATVNLSVPAQGAVLYQDAVVPAAFSCTDAGSGVAACAGTVANGSPVDTTTLGSHDFSVLATDAVGNVTAVTRTYTVVVAPDVSPPTVSCDAIPTTWRATNLTVTCHAADQSGLLDPADSTFTLATNVAAGVETAAASTGSKIICDLLGRCTTAGPFTGIKVDRKAPSATISTPSTGLVVSRGSTVSALYSCGDSGSGVGSCSGPVASGAPLGTATVGTFAFAVTATDAVGNTATASASYTVAAPIAGTVIDLGTGLPAKDVNVRLWLVGASSQAQTAVTDAAGRYSFASVPVGNYQVQFAKSGGYTTVWYQGATTRPAATVVAVDGLHNRVIDAQMSKPSSIGGTVVSDTLAPVAGATVSLFVGSSTVALASAMTAADGSWRVNNLSSGTYVVSVDATGYLSQWYNGAATRTAATAVALGSGVNLTLATALIPRPAVGRVSGTVTDSVTGLPVKSANVRFYLVGATTFTATTTSVTGAYAIDLPPGTYELQFAETAHQTRWWSASATRGGATRIILTANAQVTANATMIPK